jgi:hypothetical protein
MDPVALILILAIAGAAYYFLVYSSDITKDETDVAPETKKSGTTVPAPASALAVPVSCLTTNTCKPRQTIGDRGYQTDFDRATMNLIKDSRIPSFKPLRGWYDVQKQGVQNDYCRYVGVLTNPGWACALAGSTNPYDYTNDKNLPVFVADPLFV